LADREPLDNSSGFAPAYLKQDGKAYEDTLSHREGSGCLIELLGKGEPKAVGVRKVNPLRRFLVLSSGSIAILGNSAPFPEVEGEGVRTLHQVRGAGLSHYLQ